MSAAEPKKFLDPIKVIDAGENIKASIYESKYGKTIDIRYYYNGFPTKKGVRLSLDKFNFILKEI
jgi:hypothetical protein